MDPAWLSLLSLGFVILVAGKEKVGIGVLSLALAWIVGYYFTGISIESILDAFPVRLFLTLFGVTLFFGIASENGTLDRIASSAARLARGGPTSLFAVFFLLALALSTAGPGNIGAIAMLAPFALAATGHSGLGTFLMTLVLVSGANAGTFSPFATTGIIASQAIEKAGLDLDPWTQVYLPNLLVHSAAALAYFAIFWPHVKRRIAADKSVAPTQPKAPDGKWSVLTLSALAVFVFGAVLFKADVGFLAISLAAALMLMGQADVKLVGKVVPWNILMMVCGVSTLVQVCEKSGGLALFTDFLAKVADPLSAPALLAWTTGVVSIYSSSSGVVLPTFIPMVPGLIEKMGGGSAVALVASINAGSHLVDASPLSTLGALCVASASTHVDKPRLFHRLLLLSLAMTFVGAFISFIFFGLLADRFFAG